MRLEPTRVQAWAVRSAGAIWKAFDAQLVIYALSLAVIGLLMAYTNSGSTPLTAPASRRRSPGRH